MKRSLFALTMPVPLVRMTACAASPNQLAHSPDQEGASLLGFTERSDVIVVGVGPCPAPSSFAMGVCSGA